MHSDEVVKYSDEIPEYANVKIKISGSKAEIKSIKENYIIEKWRNMNHKITFNILEDDEEFDIAKEYKSENFSKVLENKCSDEQKILLQNILSK